MFKQRWLPFAVAVAAFVLAACSSHEDPPAPGANDLSKRLKNDTGTEWYVDVDATTQTPRFIEPEGDGPVVLKPGTSAEAAARAWLTQYKDYFGIKDVATELELEGEEKGPRDLTHVAFRQRANGVEVDGIRVAVHFDKDGRVAFVNGPFAPGAREVDAKPAIDPPAATRVAEASLPAGTSVVPGALPPALLIDPGARALVYRVAVPAVAGKKVASRIVDVDAKAGAVKSARAAAQRATETLEGVWGQSSVFNIEIDARVGTGDYRLARSYTPAKPNKPALNLRDGSASGNPVYQSADGTTWDQAGNDPGAAVDAFANFTRVENFYRSTLFMLSYNNNPRSDLNVRMHAGSDFNAYWDPASRSFGVEDGTADTKYYSFAASLDVIGHEFQHAVTEHYLKLAYQNQSGALNESLSDIFGAFVDQYTTDGGGTPLTIAETSTWPPLRNMDDPTQSDGPQPDRMSTAVSSPNTEAGDWGGVHSNSGIPNKAFAMMTVGGVHANTHIEVRTPLGWDASRTLWWEVVRGRVVGANATFVDMANATIAIARRSGRESLSAAVCAWVSVEVFDEKTAKSRWNVTCRTNRSCVADGTTCADGRACAWNGEKTGYCCRTAETSDRLCFVDSECPSGQVCTQGSDNLLTCQSPVSGDETCERPPEGGDGGT
jgi:Zn-dependent metalloprotease